MTGYVRLDIDARDNTATLMLDAPGKSVNTLNKAMWADLNEALDQIESAAPAAVIVASGKNRTFIAGADLFEMRAMDRPQLEEYLRQGQIILDRGQFSGAAEADHGSGDQRRCTGRGIRSGAGVQASRGAG